MRVLFLAHRLPYPPHKGDKIRALSIVKHLGRSHEVYVGCLVDDPGDLCYVARLRSIVQGLLFERIHLRLRRTLALPAMLRSRSISVAAFYSRPLQRRIDELIEARRIEAVFCSSGAMAEYVFRSRHAQYLRTATRIMDLMDIDSLKWQQYARESTPWTAWICRYEARRLSAFEQRIAREFDRVLVVSEQERRCFPGGSAPPNLSAVSNGVDLEFFAPGHPKTQLPGDAILVFTGVMDYRPNVEGVRWFAERILPRIRETIPDVRFYIVGSRPTAQVRRLGARKGVVVTGFVDDVRDYLAAARVCVAPLRIARGIQNKVLEAMAMGRAVICTPEAFEGILAQPGRDLLVARDEAAFAAAAIGLLRDSRRAAEIGRNARRCVEQGYSWSENLRLLDEMLPATVPHAAPAHATRRGSALSAAADPAP